MLLSHFKRLCTLLPPLISALAQVTDPNPPAPSSLPAPLQRAVPLCAQPCLLAALLDRYPLVCTSPVDVACLCSRYSSLGESLGEVAVGCLYASCPIVQSQATAAYNVCLRQTDAVQQTQTVLTVTTRSSTSSRVMASSTSLAQARPTSTRRSLSSTLSTTAQTAVADAISSTPSVTSLASTTTSDPTATAAAASSTSAPSMKPAQIAGLSVGAAAAFIIAIGLMALSAYLRNRREADGMDRMDEEEKRAFPPGASYRRFSDRSQTSPASPPKQFPLASLPIDYENPPPWTPPPARIVFDRSVASRSTSPVAQKMAAIGMHRPLKLPEVVKRRESSNVPVPLEQIGVAISAEETDSSVVMSNARPRARAEMKQPRPTSLRFTLDNAQRPTSAVTQETVFEEDVSSHRRSSRLLPTPPIPIPPIRTLQPARPPATLKTTTRPTRPVNTLTQGANQPGLSLNIPIRHSRSLDQVELQRQPTGPGQEAPPSRNISRSRSRDGRVTFYDNGNGVDIPDYYFTADGSSPESATPRSTGSKPQVSPRIITIKNKKSSSTVSRTLSKGSTNVRDSISSQTSFESVGTNDPTPEEEDEDKQLSDDKQLSPVAESPISSLRYPKVPRASNQLVPRSPRSARSSQSAQSQASPVKTLVPSALLIKRHGEQEAGRLENRLRMDRSPQRRAMDSPAKKHSHHSRSISMETGSSYSAYPSSGPRPRAHSGQWPQSPAMYDVDIVQPLRVRSRQSQQHQQQHYYQPYQWHEEREPEQAPGMEAMKSPGWVPNMTPSRRGDDLFLSVTYSKPNR